MNIINFCRPLSKIPLLSFNLGKYKRLLPLMLMRSITLNDSPERSIQRKVYNDAIPGILENLLSNSRVSQLSEIRIWLKKVLEYNLVDSNHSHGIVTMLAYDMLEKPENITEEKLHLSKVLGWCLQLLHSSCYVIDDIIDNSTTRRGAPCWYLMPDVAMGAINDAILMNCCITEILEMYFYKSPHLPQLLHLFHKAILYICMGQFMEAVMPQKKDYNLYTLKRYNDIVYYKTSYNSYQTPIELGMTLVTDIHNKINTETDHTYGNICFKLGKLLQMQNDFDDCYGQKKTGKDGTDIEEGKCTWLSATTLRHCNDSQRRRFIKYYASKDPQHVAHIMALYNELKIPQLYEQATANIYNDIVFSVRALPKYRVSNYFYKLLDDLLPGSSV